MAKTLKKEVRLPFLTEQISYSFIDVTPTLRNRNRIRVWIRTVLANEKKHAAAIGFNFCSDAYLLKVNKKYLKHDFYTDIITFDLTVADYISGDIYISTDRVRENAKNLQVPFQTELHRVMIHGVLHLCGYKDKSKREQAIMRAKEDECLSLLR